MSQNTDVRSLIALTLFIAPERQLSRRCRVERLGESKEDGVRTGQHVEVDEDLVNFHAEAFFDLSP